MSKEKKSELKELNACDVSPFEGNIICGQMVHSDICEEYFAYIKHLCIESKYREAFETSQLGEEYRAFQTFVQQSYEYYALARTASFQVAPFWRPFERKDKNHFLIPYSRSFVLPAKLAIFSVMYYLSVVVRYRPYELERLRTKNARLLWLYKCFVRNSVLTYYQILCSRLHRKYISFTL